MHVLKRQLKSELLLLDRSFKLHTVAGCLQGKDIFSAGALSTSSRHLLADVSDGLPSVFVILSLLRRCAFPHSLSGTFGSFLK